MRRQSAQAELPERPESIPFASRLWRKGANPLAAGRGIFWFRAGWTVDEALSKVLTRLNDIADGLARQQDEWRQCRAAQDAALAALHRRLGEMEDSRQLAARKTLDVSEAARYAGVESATVRRWLADGKLKGAKKGGLKQSRWRIRRQDLDTLLERTTNSPG